MAFAYQADVGIIGGGPAGSTLAIRLAQLGHRVCLVERAVFPRRHLGESLTPGVLPLLETIGARPAVEAAGFRRVRAVRVTWDQGEVERQDPTEQGLLVDRGPFDQLLLQRARAAGVRVLQPAVVRERHLEEKGWRLRLDAAGRPAELRAAFLAHASGRAAGLPARTRATGSRTLALYGYWAGSALPQEPRIEAGPDEWYWGVPLPNGSYNTLVFVDLERYRRERTAPLGHLFHEWITRSGLLAGARDARLMGRVGIAEATPYLAPECVSPRSIKVGDAALAIDPLSSSGVQKAIQTALSGALVVNTLLRRPESCATALRFYRDTLEDAAHRHRGWAAAHYGTVAAQRGGSFWLDRAGPLALPSGPKVSTATAPSFKGGEEPNSHQPVELSPRLEITLLPCLEDEFVTLKPTVRHPDLDRPLTYLGGFELAPLLHLVRPGMTPLQIASAWSARVPLPVGLHMTGWLLAKGLLVPGPARFAGEGARAGTLSI